MSRGYVVTAIPSKSGDYISNAYCLALSLLLTQKNINKLSVMTNDLENIPPKYKTVFDNILVLPEPDLSISSDWKVQNFYQLFRVSPYEETVVIDADTLFFDDVDEWWNLFTNKNVVATKRIVDYRGKNILRNPLREYTYKHHLPDIHNGFFYFDKSPTTEDLFDHIKDNTIHWKSRCLEMFGENIHFSSDGVLQMSVKQMDALSDFTLQNDEVPVFVHMKTCMQGWENATDKDWRKYVTYSFDKKMMLEIGGYRIRYPFHYHIREFATDCLIRRYEKALGI